MAADPAELLHTVSMAAAEPAGLGPAPSFLPGSEAVVQEAAQAVAQGRHMFLQTDAEGAIQMLKRLESVPTVKEYRALVAALHNAEALAFLTQQKTGLGLAYSSGSGFLIKRLRGQPPGQPHWSAPSYFRGCGVDLGVVLGFEYLQILLCIRSERVMDRLTLGEMHLGVDLTAMAGAGMLRDMAARPARVSTGDPSATISFSIASGAMLGASIQIGWTHVNHHLNRRAFGDLTLFGATDVTPEQLLSGRVPPPPEFQCLYQALDKLSSIRPWA